MHHITRLHILTNQNTIFYNYTTNNRIEFVLREPNMGRRPIAGSGVIFFGSVVGVELWGLKILTPKIQSSVGLFRILDRESAAGCVRQSTLFGFRRCFWLLAIHGGI
jgi:hypothetical protein